MEVKRVDELGVALKLHAMMAHAGASPAAAAKAGKKGGSDAKKAKNAAKEARRLAAEAAKARKLQQAEAARAMGKGGAVTGDAPRRQRAKRSEFPLPVAGRRNLLLTSALPYVNNVPHLGNIIGCVLSGDVFARYARQRGHNVAYVCGTDEYGTATEAKAREEGMTPRQVCDKYHAVHAEVYDWFDISFDHFGRTSCPEPRSTPDWPQTVITQDIFNKANANGHILEKSVSQQFCETCDTFLADRFIEGTCPLCNYADARGDQCDGCGKLIDATELIEPRCKQGRDHRVVIKSSTHLFLDLPGLSPKLKAWLEATSTNWSPNAVQQTMAWFATDEGLLPRCITRDLKWGTPVPLPAFADKVFYVWFDAPIGYISITATATPDWKQWWQNPENVELYQFMGKDNVPFHTIIFPSSLIASGDPWTKLTQLSTTEYLNYEKTKFSKSRGVGVFGLDAKNSGIPSEVWRYYLLNARPENADTDFSWADFGERTNNELLKNLGNFVNRVVALTNKFYKGVAPAAGELTTDEEQLRADVNAKLAKYIELMDAVQLRNGLACAMAISSLGNSYLQHTAPWVLHKSDPGRCQTVIASALALTKLVAAVLEPFMPGFADKVYHQLNMDHTQVPDMFVLDFPVGHKVNAAQPIFRAITSDELNAFRAKFAGGESKSEEAAGAGAGGASSDAASAGKGGKKKGGDGGKKKGGDGGKKKGGKKGGAASDRPMDVSRIDMRVGVIKRVWPHPDADRLFCEEIDIGEAEPRQIASGLREHYAADDLLGRKVVVIANLKPRKMRGFMSHGMVLCGKVEVDGREVVEFADPPADAQAGDRVTAAGFDGEPDDAINPMKKNNPWTAVVPDLTVESGVAVYQGKPLATKAGPCTTKTIQAGILSQSSQH